MIVFYPHDNETWRQTGDFDFAPSITLTPKRKTNFKEFHNKQEFIEYLKSKGVSLIDPVYPLIFKDLPLTNKHVWRPQEVFQRVSLGTVITMLP